MKNIEFHSFFKFKRRIVSNEINKIKLVVFFVDFFSHKYEMFFSFYNHFFQRVQNKINQDYKEIKFLTTISLLKPKLETIV